MPARSRRFQSHLCTATSSSRTSPSSRSGIAAPPTSAATASKSAQRESPRNFASVQISSPGTGTYSTTACAPCRGTDSQTLRNKVSPPTTTRYHQANWRSRPRSAAEAISTPPPASSPPASCTIVDSPSKRVHVGHWNAAHPRLEREVPRATKEPPRRHPHVSEWPDGPDGVRRDALSTTPSADDIERLAGIPQQAVPPLGPGPNAVVLCPDSAARLPGPLRDLIRDSAPTCGAARRRARPRLHPVSARRPRPARRPRREAQLRYRR